MKYILSLGSNKGDRHKFIRRGIAFLSKLGKITSESSIYETSPVGMGDHANYFMNSVIVLESSIEPYDLLNSIKQFERNTGRNLVNSHLQPRKIDIDILFADDLRINSPILTIPHPEIEKRRFILEPLSEIIPDFTHPVSGLSIRELLNNLVSDEKVNLYDLETRKKI